MIAALEAEGNPWCPGCSAFATGEYAFSRGDARFRVCRSCRLTFRDPMPTAAQLADIYKTHYKESNIVGQSTNQESGAFATGAYAEFLDKHFLKAKSRLLDVGAGTGVLVEAFRQRGIVAEGVEFSAEARQHCSQFRGFDLIEDINSLPESAFDVVTMIEVIEHLSDPVGDLRSIIRRLRPGGVLFLTTPNLKGLRARIQGGSWREAQKLFHLTLFEASTLRAMLGKVGFSDIRRIRFSPIQNAGTASLIYARACQLAGLHGTLAMIARR